MLAPEVGEDHEARQLKRAKIRDWLVRKDAELLEKRRAEEEEARQDQEGRQQRQQRNLAQQADEQQKRLGRLQAAARRKKAFALQVQQASATEDGPLCISKASMAKALATYGKPKRPVSARSQSSGKACVGGERTAKIGIGKAL